MIWQPPEPAIPASLLMPEKGGLYGPCYALDQLLAVRREALNDIASWGEGAEVNGSFDEPDSAEVARKALEATK